MRLPVVEGHVHHEDESRRHGELAVMYVGVSACMCTYVCTYVCDSCKHSPNFHTHTHRQHKVILIHTQHTQTHLKTNIIIYTY